MELAAKNKRSCFLNLIIAKTNLSQILAKDPPVL